ncbi:MAG: (2Fe-2S)-binding protein [Rhodospirillaceae bacterium]|nr:(2Fe-2S)-binding protein [Rhodospirillaceae bacterium]|tara:strand:+ start:5905 stop:6402 length:498 start_codon:yes stop_codon:yes gene_type:complete
MPQLNKEAKHPVTINLNGKEVNGYAEPRMLLTDFLTHEIGITSCHVGCEHGVCGACTVLVDGNITRACLTFAVQADGCTVDTSESLADENGELSGLQKAFKKHHGLQCGYCTTGVLMSVTAYLRESPNPTEEELRTVLSGHLCRCTGYVGMVRAVMDYCENRPNK